MVISQLLGFSRSNRGNGERVGDEGLGKLFFDTFSKRMSTIEESVGRVLNELEDLKLARDRSQISDLVLLERLQRAETTLVESLEWIKKVATAVESSVLRAIGNAGEAAGPPEAEAMVPTQQVQVPRNIVLPGGETGSLSSITTPTELQVLGLLSEQGAKSSPEIGRLVGRSREHSARLMKKLFEEGYVKRDQSRIPFRYSLVDRVKASFEKPMEKKEEPREEAAPVEA